jgi:hypothetical protein
MSMHAHADVEVITTQAFRWRWTVAHAVPGVRQRRGHLSLPAGNQCGELSEMNDIAVYQ